ncbi:MAG: hypothetical protein SF172_11845 [Burkholderiales bacterium]|nr:hypothetical protein [Burkholderiales bacterium]
MKSIQRLIAITLSAFPMLAFAGAGDSHGDEHKPKYGGVVVEVKEVQYELVAKADSLAIFIEDHGKKVGTKGASAKVTLLSGKDRTEATLVAAGDNKLEANGSFNVGKGTKVVAVVTLAGKPATSVRFTLK